MNPMLLADWGRINRLFRTLMWLVAIVLAAVVVTMASPHASGSPAHAAAGAPGKTSPSSRGLAAGILRQP
jgi:hypothetical protein